MTFLFNTFLELSVLSLSRKYVHSVEISRKITFLIVNPSKTTDLMINSIQLFLHAHVFLDTIWTVMSSACSNHVLPAVKGLRKY